MDISQVAAAGGIYARTGISFGGLTFDGSDDGVPRGTPTNETITPGAEGTYCFDIEPASVAILTLPDAPADVREDVEI